jgi:hypothetical protein
VTTPVNLIPTAATDGVIYSSNVPITGTEADLWGGSGVQVPDPIPVAYGAGLIAVVQLVINGHLTGNNTYVVMQADLGDGVWVDLNWLVWTGTDASVPVVFVFSNGVAGANSFQQSRIAGQSPNPQQSGANQMVLGGRIRFVGRTTSVGGSSSLSGVATAVIANIRYKVLGLN